MYRTANCEAGNLMARLPDVSGREQIEILTSRAGTRIERIVSRGQATPEGNWYDQAWHEWVVLLRGEALLLIEHEEQPRRLTPGDWLLLPAGCRHRVEWTAQDQETVWLAVHWPDAAQK